MEGNVTLCSPRLSTGLNPHQPILAVSQVSSDCPPNHVLIKVDRFGFSANNITYQALGEHPHFRYFDFNPAPEIETVSPRTHGLIPVWGFGTVAASSHPKISQGERVYGYFAPTRYLLIPVSPSDVNKYSFYVPRPHLPADRRPYNQIIRCASDPHYFPDPAIEDLTMLYRPLFWTSYWCEDWLFSSKYRGGASSILISSASSKTAFCLAYLIKKRRSRGETGIKLQIAGLTSKGNFAFTKGLGLYDDVYEYDTFTSEKALHDKNSLWIYVDVAGNDDLNKRILGHFASPYTGSVAACIALGLTNLSPSAPGTDAIEWSVNTFNTSPSPVDSDKTPASPFWPKFEQFFMPEWLDVRKHQIPIAEILRQQNDAWKELMTDCRDWVEMDRIYGPENVKEAYEHVARKGLGPARGLVWSMWEKDSSILMSRL